MAVLAAAGELFAAVELEVTAGDASVCVAAQVLQMFPGIGVAVGVDAAARAQIEAHIGDPHSVRWVKMAALLLHGKSSCVDGRDDNGCVTSFYSCSGLTPPTP